MGVKLKDIVEPKTISFKDLEGRSVSIDAFNTLYQFLSTIRQRDGRPLTDENGNVTSHLSGILYRNSSMIEKDIKPIYIFDGTAPELKSETQAKRREIREESERIFKEALAEGDTEKARKFAMRSSKLSPEIIESSKKLLTLMGIPYIEAKGEGEAHAAALPGCERDALEAAQDGVVGHDGADAVPQVQLHDLVARPRTGVGDGAGDFEPGPGCARQGIG